MERMQTTEEQRRQLHYTADGLLVAAFLRLPFNRPTNGKQPKIEETWFYRPGELADHGKSPYHCRIDWKRKYGTAVYSPCDGVAAIATFQGGKLMEGEGEDRHQRLYKDQGMYWGLGYFVELFHAETNISIQLGHLSMIDERIPFSIPEPDGEGGWNPKNHRLNASKFQVLLDSGLAVPVQTGQLVGYIGHSGLGLDYCDYQEGMKRPEPIDPNRNKSYDDDHLDMGVIRNENNERIPMDPYGIYDYPDQYPQKMREPLWILNDQGMPRYARENEA